MNTDRDKKQVDQIDVLRRAVGDVLSAITSYRDVSDELRSAYHHLNDAAQLLKEHIDFQDEQRQKYG